MIDWQALTRNLRRHYGSLARAATALDLDENLLRRLNRGETSEPKFEPGIRLLDAHYDACPDRHRHLVRLPARAVGAR